MFCTAIAVVYPVEVVEVPAPASGFPKKSVYKEYRTMRSWSLRRQSTGWQGNVGQE